MRIVHKPEMVAHLWAHQSQPTAKNPGGTFYFEGDTIYSYGRHFPIARIVANKSGKAVLFTVDSHSVTTAHHKNIALRACNHLTVFHVDNVNGTPKETIAYYRGRFAALVKEYGKAKGRKPAILATIRGCVKEANEYCALFGLKTRLVMPDNVDEMAEEAARVDKANKARELVVASKRAKELQAYEEKEQRERDTARFLWVGGQAVPSYRLGGPVLLRVVGDKIETTQGAEFPLDHAVKAYRLLKRLRETGQTYQRNGHTIHLGAFALDSFDGQTVEAGCHRIEWAEVERVAMLAGVN